RRGRTEHALTMVRAARVGVAVRARDLPGRALLEDPQGRRDLGAAVSREEVPMDQETFDRVLAEELGKGTDRRVAEGRARSAAVRAYRKAHGEPERAARPAAPAAAPSGDGDGAAGDGGGPGTPEPAGVGASTAAAAGPAAG